MIEDFYDWRGGYCVDVPDEEMEDYELKTAENCYWDNGVRKRGGIEWYASVSGDAVMGHHRLYTAGAWRSILAVESSASTAVHFVQGTADTFSEITLPSGTTYSFTASCSVQFANLGVDTVAVNGTDRPCVIYEDGSSLYVQTLDEYDTRTRDYDDWYAGQIDSGGNYTSDTDDLQDVGSADFPIASSTGTSGFWISCDLVFSKIILSDVEAMTGSFTTNYEFWNGSSWASIPTINNTPTWTAVGDKELEWEIPLENDGSLTWKVYGEDDDNDDILNRYIIRVMFDGNTNTPSAALGEVQHTHYLSQILADERPSHVAVHKNHVFLSAGNQVQISVVNQLTDWRADRYEYFFNGGREIYGMISHNDYLAIIKERAVFGIYGTSWADWTTTQLTTEGGAIGRRAFAVSRNILWMVNKDGIYIWDEDEIRRISKHIWTDFNGIDVDNCAMVEYKGNLIITFPDSEYAIWLDPDTIRTDSMGDRRVSIFKWTNYNIEGFQNCSGGGDTGYLLGIDNNYPGLALCDTNNYDNRGTASAIGMSVQSKFYDYDTPGVFKRFGRIKPRVSDVTATAGISYILTLMKNDENGGVSSTVTMNAGVGTGYHQEYYNIPYNIDGRNFGIKIEHDTAYDAKFFGFTLDSVKRRY